METRIGISVDSLLLRRHLLGYNRADVAMKMLVSGISDPVGLIVDTTDAFGKIITYAALESHGIPKHEIPETIGKYSRDATPTFTFVLSFEEALRLLPLTSPSAAQNLQQSRPAGAFWIVVIAGSGNSYSLVSF